ncbi:hypothetical protein KIL84_012558, partial [Mauremys mutica]
AKNAASGPENYTSDKPEKQPVSDVDVCVKDVAPLGILANSDVELDKDKATAEEGMLGVTVIPKQVTSSLSLLVANYSNTSDNESLPEEGPVKIVTKVVVENKTVARDTSRTSNIVHILNNMNNKEHAKYNQCNIRELKYPHKVLLLCHRVNGIIDPLGTDLSALHNGLCDTSGVKTKFCGTSGTE